MNNYAELEISLHHYSTESYMVDFRFNKPDSDAEIRLPPGEFALAYLNPSHLRSLINEPEPYAQALTDGLFADPALKSAFSNAIVSAQTENVPLRLRLIVGPTAPVLHELCWELLLNPQDGSPLSTSQNVLFSRYLSSQDWRPVRLRSKRELRALVVVANPTNLAEHHLAEVDVDEEVKRARQGLGNISLKVLPNPEQGKPASLHEIMAAFRGSNYDIGYLVCHGALVKGEPWLWLEDIQGKVKRVRGEEFAQQIKELTELPRLMILASCQSAGSDSGGALAAVGPKLVEAGVPAVLAMNGKVSMTTIEEFMPVFFEELQRDGQIDRALAEARAAVRERHDYWMPVLYMRLQSGRLWYVPGFSDEKDSFKKWESITRAIQAGNCTPIIGPGLSEPLLGTGRDIALSWSEQHGFPMEPKYKDHLPSVAQYIVTRHDSNFLRQALGEAIGQALVRKYGDYLPENMQQSKYWTMDDLLKGVEIGAEQRWGSDPDQSFRMLAKLKLPIYITTNYSNLLENALIEANAEPQTRVCPWNDFIPNSLAIYNDEPSPERPLVYHLFGHLSEPQSVVLTEDEYFDYLIGVARNKRLIPEVVRGTLTNSALLFMGFHMDDWSFRVFFRFLMAQEGRKRLELFSHVAAQIEFEESLIMDATRARNYLENYFQSEKISIYWGSAKEFLKELLRNLEAVGV